MSLDAPLFDSHAHLDFADFGGEVDAVLERARAAGLVGVVAVGAGRGLEAAAAVDLAARFPDVWATVGIHPHDASCADAAALDVLRKLAARPRVVALGEIGLDYHYDHSPRPDQERAFRRSLAAARAAGKPVVVHVREADEVCARVLREEGVPPAGGVIHCFTGDAAAARTYLDLGLFISVSGVVTFRTADAIREAVRLVPRDRLLVETDSPFLAPVPHRGKRNEPAFVAETARKVAEVRGEDAEDVARVTSENARRLFRLP